jgi:sec-independent protein translocase protein TatA
MMPLAFFSNLAGPDLILILLIVLVLFGAKRLPELARGMGQAVKEFQKARNDLSDELHRATVDPLPHPKNAPLPNESAQGQPENTKLADDRVF